MTLNLALKTAILRRGLTQRQVARALTIDETRLSRIIRRQIEPAPEERAVLAQLLGESEQKLFALGPTARKETRP